MKRLLALIVAVLLGVAAAALPALAKDGDDDRDDDIEDVEDDDRDDEDRDDGDLDHDNSGPGSAHSGRDDDDDDRDDDDRDDDNSPDDDGTPDQGSGDAPGTPGGGPEPPPAGVGSPSSTATVSLTDKTFSPVTVSVSTGGTVTWRNTSDREHTVTADDGSFDSGVVNPGQSFSVRVSEPGTVAYRCLIHSGMTGQVTVGGGDRAPRSGPDGQHAVSRTATSSSPGASGSSGGPALGAAASGSGRPVPPPATAQAAGGTTTVEVKDFSFNPATLTIAPGTEVQWSNTGQALHTVTGDSFDSGMLRSGQSFSHTFESEGTFDYRCDFHPDMTATVEVTAAGSSAKTGDDPGAAGDGGAGTRTVGAAATSGPLAATGASMAAAALLGLAALGVGVWLVARRSRGRLAEPSS